MTEINVMIPISLLGTNFTTAEGISDALAKAQEVHATIPALRINYMSAVQKVHDIGSYLDELLSNPIDSMERAQKLRQLIVDCKNYGGS